MKQGLSLRASQHLALTPQLQQSIRLLQLSTLELGQELSHMLDDNPFLELDHTHAEREDFGLTQADTPAADEPWAQDGFAPTASEFTPEFSPDLSAAPSLAAPVDLPNGAEAARAVPTLESVHEAAYEAAHDSSLSGLSELSEGLDGWGGDGSVELNPDDSEWGGDAPPQGHHPEAASATELARSQDGLAAHLRRQALGLRLAALDAHALAYLIDSLNEDGYLEDSLEDLAQSLVRSAGPTPTGAGRSPAADTPLSPAQQAQCEALLDPFGLALRLLQSLEPVGVGARHLAECLDLQLQALQRQAQQRQALSSGAQPHNEEANCLALARQIVRQPLDQLARRDVRKLCQATRAGAAQVRQALGLIATLEPKPGRRFVDVTQQLVVPDVLVRALGSGPSLRLSVRLNPDVLPKLRVQERYAQALRSHKPGASETASFMALQQRLQEARWFIKNIQQRFDTILRVSQAIVERQRNFFLHGELAMRPLVLREIADALGLHESTISRVTTAKYMATPFGTYELKYFFGSGLGTDSGASASSTAVRALIKQLVAAESPVKPLSDNDIAALLKAQGIDCARRTVAKYREALKIAPANLRKTL